MAISAAGHALLVAALVLFSGVLNRWNNSKVYVVNLVPAVAAVGSSSRALPPRPSSPAVSSREPERAVEETAPKAKAQLPEAALREPRSATRPPALPGLKGKELPPLASERRPLQPAVATPSAKPEPRSPTPESRPAPVAPIPLGRPGGSPAGTASLTLDVSDFPFTYYLRQIQQKISEKWVPPARASEPGRRVVVLFEIGRDGQVRSSKVERSSGNVLYDQSALRAVVEATPFPPLPKEFPAQSLRVHFGFEFQQDRG